MYIIDINLVHTYARNAAADDELTIPRLFVSPLTSTQIHAVRRKQEANIRGGESFHVVFIYLSIDGIFKLLRSPGIDSKKCSLAGRYNNPIPTRFLARIDCPKTPAQKTAVEKGGGGRSKAPPPIPILSWNF
jgi:hypothetical protein